MSNGLLATVVAWLSKVKTDVAAILVDTAAMQPTIATNLDGKISEISGALSYNVETFTANGTFTVPTGFKGWVFVSGCAAGGGGGFDSASGDGGGGAGAGEIAWRVAIYIDQAVTSSVSVTIGTGGTGATSGNNGTAGTNTSFGSYLVLEGGGPGFASGVGGYGGGDPSQSTTSADTVGANVTFSTDALEVIYDAMQPPIGGFTIPGLPGGGGAQSFSTGEESGEYIGVPIFDTTHFPDNNTVSVSNDGGQGGSGWGGVSTDPDLSSDPAAADPGNGGHGSRNFGATKAQDGGRGELVVEYFT